MTKRDDKHAAIQKEVQKTLGLLDNVEDIEPDLYFYSRLQTRFGDSGEVGPLWLERYIVGEWLVPSLFAVVIALNVVTAVATLKGTDKAVSYERDIHVQAIANEYLLTGTSIGPDIDAE